MQELSYDRFDYWVDNGGVRWQKGQKLDISKEDLMKSPLEMYLYALSIKDKLPEEMHNAMLLWSYDQDSSEYVKSYLDWVENCEERKKSREKFEKQMVFHERLMKVITFVVAIGLVYVLLM